MTTTNLLVARSGGVPPAELLALFAHAPWASTRTRVDLARMMHGSFLLITARRGDRLVGFGRAWGDGVYRAVLDDIVVVPEERGNALGSRIVEALLTHCRELAIEEVSLTCRPELAGFYERLGFRRYDGATLKLREPRDA
ncbi:hypothetical protein IP84_15000 [beta proteobacterium AAP99]|nr:hypothetical protein IP84_15000 [beta proteobacterium AAP99]